MSLFVLDTDALTLLEEAHPIVADKAKSVPAGDMAVTVVTVEEKLTGWYTICTFRQNLRSRHQFHQAFA